MSTPKEAESHTLKPATSIVVCVAILQPWHSKLVAPTGGVSTKTK